FGSNIVSAATFTVMSLLVSPGANVREPESGPTKSRPFAAGWLFRLMTQLTEEVFAVPPFRSSSNVKGVDAPGTVELPSALFADTGTIETTGTVSSFWMVPRALAASGLMVAPDTP